MKKKGPGRPKGSGKGPKKPKGSLTTTQKGTKRKIKFTELQIRHNAEVQKAREEGWITNEIEKQELISLSLKEHNRNSQGKYEVNTVEKGVAFISTLIDWYYSNPSVYYLKEYYNSKSYTECFEYFKLNVYRNKFPICEKLYNYLLELQESRIVKAALEGKIQSNTANFMLSNIHKWVGRTEQEIMISTKEIIFTFDNSAKLDEGEDITYEDINDDLDENKTP